MRTRLNTELLSSKIKEKRGDSPLRATAKAIGDVSAATLSRIEQGNLPDVETFLSLCEWLECSTEVFILENENSGEVQKEVTNKDVAIAHLRADKTLSPKAAETLINVINHFYNPLNR